MSYSTKNASGESLDQARERNWFGYGIQYAAISGFSIKTASTGSKKVILELETPKVTDAGFKASDSAAWGGKTGTAAFSSWLASPEAENELVNRFDLIGRRLGMKAELDAIDEPDLETYVAAVVKALQGKFGYWKITAEEYPKSDGSGVGRTYAISRYTFFKTKEQVKQIETDASGEISKIFVNTKDDGNTMAFDINDKYDYKRLVEEEGDQEVSTQQSGGALWDTEEEPADEAAAV